MTIFLRGDVAHSLVEDKSKEAILRGEPSILGEGRELHTSDHLDHHSSLLTQISVTKSATHHFSGQLFQDKQRLSSGLSGSMMRCDQYSPWEGVEGEGDVSTWMLCLCSRTEDGSSLDPLPVIVLRSPAGDPCRLASLSLASSSVN